MAYCMRSQMKVCVDSYNLANTTLKYQYMAFLKPAELTRIQSVLLVNPLILNHPLHLTPVLFTAFRPINTYS